MPSSLALLTLAAVLAAPAAPAPKKPTHTPQTVDLTPPSRRWIAATTSRECPRPVDAQNKQKSPLSSPVWTMTPAFPRTGRVVGNDVPLPAALGRFCIYTRASPSADPPAFTAEAQRTISRIDPDYDVLVPQGPGIPGPLPELPGPGDLPHTDIPQAPDEGRPDFDTPEKRAKKLHDAAAALFAESAGVTRKSLSPSPIYAANSGPHAYLAILDTASPADGEAGYDKARFARHGLAMAAIAEAVRCPTGDEKCLAHTHLGQAYPNVGLKRAAKISSPQLGSPISLAQAIWATLDDWRTARRGVSKHAPLVLNLSLGWDPKRHGTIPDDLVKGHLVLLDEAAGAEARARVPVPVQMIHAALVYASCLDALTIAAAGNAQEDSCDAEGPLDPGQWERLAAPTRKQCEALFAGAWLESPHPGLDVRFAGPRSLVYAVGGLSVVSNFGSDTPNGLKVLSMSRPGSVAPRLISASHAVGTWKNQRTGAWSGTSVAAAAYSGLAAAVWTQRPELTSHELVAAIDRSGREWSSRADFPTPGRKSYEILGQKAYKTVCGLSAPGKRPCDANPYLASDATLRATLADQYRDAAMSASNLQEWAPSAAEGALNTYSRDLGCGRQRRHFYPTGQPQFPSIEYPLPWVRPQPEVPICSVCPIKGTKLYLSLNPAALGTYLPDSGIVTLVDATLQFGGDSANLGDLTVSRDGAEVDLESYRIGSYPLTTTFNFSRLDEGTLTVTVTAADGQRATVTSVVQVLH